MPRRSGRLAMSAYVGLILAVVDRIKRSLVGLKMSPGEETLALEYRCGSL